MRIASLLFTLALCSSLSAQDDIRLFRPSNAVNDSVDRPTSTPPLPVQVHADSVEPGTILVTESDRIKAIMADYASRKQPLKGFRVQIFLGDRTAAENTRRDFLRQHPDTPAYLSYLAPNFRVRVGDLRDRVAAEHMREQLRSEFPGLYVVPDQIEPPRFPSISTERN
ncbi:MAG: SPOR domain-containing protein [Flavobacteriales bacterium]|jgi:hypothetical protein|nr:SPOR domain-containing protein [Flavobacteriales bacterium]MCB0758656.1 SPOR domain-containing protein [Flavobacteriales bacterium]